MTARAASSEATTYLLEGSELARVVDFVAELGKRGVTAPEPQPALVDAGGTRISRPTLVRLLADGEIAYEQRGRHRRILLPDLLAYKEKMRRDRRESLERMAREGQAAGLYEATAGPAPRTR